MNVAKLEELKRWIMAEPRRYRQNDWFFAPGSAVVKQQNPPCGTVACLAGNACLMEGWTPDYSQYAVVEKRKELECAANVAQKILGLTGEEANDLFRGDASGWPTSARRAYHAARSVKQRAKAAAMAIDALIETGRQGRKTPKRRKAAH